MNMHISDVVYQINKFILNIIFLKQYKNGKNIYYLQ
jgi:hypothetical protein